MGELAILDDVRIIGDTNGDGMADITISGDADSSGTANAGDSRIFSVSDDATIDAVDMTGGYTSNGSGGGAILHAGGTLNV